MDEVQKVVIIPQGVETLCFFDTVAANSSKTLVSKPLLFPYTVERFRAHFALNTNKQLRVKFYLSLDDSAPTSEPLTGENVLGSLGQVDYLVGDDEPVEIPYRLGVPVGGMYVKVFAVNLDSYEHTIDAQVFISRSKEVGA
jgi:hypothetical protein